MSNFTKSFINKYKFITAMALINFTLFLLHIIIGFFVGFDVLALSMGFVYLGMIAMFYYAILRDEQKQVWELLHK